METEARDEVKKIMIDLIRSDPEVHAALRARENEEARRVAPQLVSRIASETSATIKRMLDRKYRL